VEVGGIQVDVGELDVADKTCAERADDLVELAADARHLRLGDPRVDTERSDQIIDGPGRHATDIGLRLVYSRRFVSSAEVMNRGRRRDAR
jgi:hypothetical protein